MSFIGSKPIRFRPRSLADTLDESNAQPGACMALQNLIPDPATLSCLECRPAATTEYNFSDFMTPGIVSAAWVIGSRVYGLIATGKNAGHDEPFVYDTQAEAFVAVSGVTAANTPLTPASTGAWTPPTMDAVGTRVIVTHPGFGGAATGYYFGYFDISGFSETTTGNIASGQPTITGNPLIAGVGPGYAITGAGIPANTTVSNVVQVTPQSTGNINSGLVISSVASLTGINPGDTITGTGIPAGTTVISASGTAIVMSQPATATNAGVTITDTTTSTSTTGNVFSGYDITGVASVAGFAIGQPVASVGFLNPAIITGISGTTITVNEAAIETAAGVTISATGAIITMNKNATANTNNLSISIAGGTLGAPLWAAGNTTNTGLVGVPSSVRQFNNRAYFSVANAEVFTDVLTLNQSTATQVLIIGDQSPIIAQCPLTILTASTATVAGLVVFKQNFISFISGDPTTGNLAESPLSNSGNGTAAGRSVCACPSGILFMDSDGIRLINLNGSVQDPLPDVRVPFINPVQRSRVSAAYNGSVYRICVENGSVGGTPYQEFWYDFKYKMWTGPHTFRQDLILPFGSSFIAFSNSFPSTMYKSDSVQTNVSGFVENGSQLLWIYDTANLADLGDVNANSAIETTINLDYAGATTITANAVNESGSVLSTAFINLLGALTIWGAFIWGAAIWFGIAQGLRPYRIPWTNALVFSKMNISLTGASVLGLKMSNYEIYYQPLNYIIP